MGGNALKNTETVRMIAGDYFKVESDVLDRLSQFGLRVSTIPAYSDKESFGDMDVMIMYHDGVDYMDIVNSFNPNEVFRNGKVISFDYLKLQIDLIITRKEFFDFSRDYYSFNDLGNLMGRIAHKLGLKYGHEGLTYTFRDDNKNIVGSVLLTRDIKNAFEFLDYDYERFTKGFDNLNDIFEFVVSSKYFNPEIFNLDNRNHQAKTRDRKRPTYTAFLEYCSANEFKNSFSFGNKNDYLPMIQKAFPHFEVETQKLKDKLVRKKAIRSKFNGNKVMEWTGLQSKELGSFMAQFKNAEFESWAIDSSDKDVQDRVMIAFVEAESHMHGE